MNIFRQAKELLDKKDAGGELTEEELKLINMTNDKAQNHSVNKFI